MNIRSCFHLRFKRWLSGIIHRLASRKRGIRPDIGQNHIKNVIYNLKRPEIREKLLASYSV